jgi:hypothetical protein
MNPSGTSIYLIISLLIGAAQIVDAGMLWRTKGKLNSIVMAFSKLEIIWAAVSLVIWKEINAPIWFSLSFTAYVVLLFIWGLVLRKRTVTEFIPKFAILAGGVFGIYFTATAGVLLFDK